MTETAWNKHDIGYFAGTSDQFMVDSEADIYPTGNPFLVQPYSTIGFGAPRIVARESMRKHPTHPLTAFRRYGWHRSEHASPHPRYAIPAHHAAGHLPASVDLTPECPAVYDQGTLGSCTANALAGLFQFLLMKEGKAAFVPSRLMIYWGERAIEGTVAEDAGANGDDGVTFLATKGVCPETLWPYDPAKFADEPPLAAWASAFRHKIAQPVTIADGDRLGLRSCLASGLPIAFGFTAYPDLESDKVAATGNLPMRAKGEPSIGGHEVLLVGYDDTTGLFKCRNSWGPAWGIRGYFTMPYAYVSNPDLAGDFRSASTAS